MSVDMDVMTETYEDVESFVKNLARKFAIRYGEDPEECVQDAGILFIRAYHSYSLKRNTSFQSWVYTHVWGGLMDKLRTKLMRNKRLKRINYDFDYAADADQEEFSLDDKRFSDLSEEAMGVLKMVVESPYEIYINAEMIGKPDNLKQSLKDILRGLNWTHAQIRNTFNEIKEALSL